MTQDPTNLNKVPRHVGLILDGNRRWARSNGLEPFEGHRKGYELLKKVSQHLFDQGVDFVSAYVFSTENWKRTQAEVKYLMDLLLRVVSHDLKSLAKDNIRIKILGFKTGLSPEILKAIERSEKSTSGNTRGTLGLCLNYGGRGEIVEAAKAALAEGRAADSLDEAAITRHLWAPDIPDIDLVIRTSGEQRLSNFMLWRAAYSEFYFMEKHWPAVTIDDIDDALGWFAGRERRFGGDKPA